MGVRTSHAYIPLLSVILFVCEVIPTNDIKGLDDAILFRMNWPGPERALLLESLEYEKLLMTTSNNEQFHCLVPVNIGENNDDGDQYKGPSAISLLMPLFQKQTCNLRLESYWTYELCHGSHLKQYRDEREGKTTRSHEYILGVTSLEELSQLRTRLEEDLKINPNPVIPTIKVEGKIMPYFMVNYTGGTTCDLTNGPRVSHILFVCFEDGRHDIYSIKETYTCEYEIVVLSPTLCQHPSYRPRDDPQTDLHCIPVNSQLKRPRNLLQFEAESLKLRTNGAVLSGDTSSGSVKLEIVENPEEAEIVVEKHEPQSRLPLFPPQPSVDTKLVEDFLNGDYCLHGGSGWWKYEFCYGRKVEQYHENRDGTRIVNILGLFDAENHKKWIKKHPEKQYKRGRRQVSHFYSGGTVCDITSRRRQVEVKLKCKETESPSAVTIYLLEPHTCEYTLVLETSIVCPLLQHADELGLFTLAEERYEYPEQADSQPVVHEGTIIPEEHSDDATEDDYDDDDDYDEEDEDLGKSKIGANSDQP
ncbi:hypothetical protein SK128_026987 [Halocaridina rubra]|uniref:Endoplasmic reticulum lectin 1 n=1 Tax=Halocaridina rubra TaxID=373956 RepID=A0AAN8X2L4_HALRR